MNLCKQQWVLESEYFTNGLYFHRTTLFGLLENYVSLLLVPSNT